MAVIILELSRMKLRAVFCAALLPGVSQVISETVVSIFSCDKSFVTEGIGGRLKSETGCMLFHGTGSKNSDSKRCILGRIV